MKLIKSVAFTGLIVSLSGLLFAQGSIDFRNLSANYKPNYPYVYGPFPDNPTKGLYGNDKDYTGAPLLEGTGYCAWLLAAPGLNRSLKDMAPAFGTGNDPNATYTPFNTGVKAGFWVSCTVIMTNVPKESPCTVAVVAWENKGKYYTWGEAYQAWLNGEIAAAITPTFNITQCGGDFVLPPVIPGLEKFNIYYIPEPGVYVLGGLALAAVWVFRKRN